MPGKEILISRPDEITVVYYTDEFKYEENKLLGPAARLFDQNAQLLDGITPDMLGLVSDIAEDGSLADLTDEEFKEMTDIYKKYVSAKVKALEADIAENEELNKQYTQLKFTESVINGRASVVANSLYANRAQRRAAARRNRKKGK